MRRNTIYKYIILGLVCLFLCSGIVWVVGFEKTRSIIQSTIDQNQTVSNDKSSNQNQNSQSKNNQSNPRSQANNTKKDSPQPQQPSTNPKIVAQYVKENGKLPDYYITKAEAAKRGWDKGENVCQISDDSAIGGDYFSNFDGKLPTKPGRKWYEADINYHCGHRGSDRLLYSSDRLTYQTLDHYETFTEIQ